MRLWLAFQAFFRIVSDADFATGVKRLRDESPGAGEPPAPAPEPTKRPPPKPARSEAITLLATLQREARFVDIITESLDGYSDAQVGAAARGVLRDCGKVVDRMFALHPAVSQQEGEAIEVPEGYDAGRLRLTGNVSKQPPLSGQVVHAGWQAEKCEVPQWSGTAESALVVAPAEIQVG